MSYEFQQPFPRERELSPEELEEARLTFLGVYDHLLTDPETVPSEIQEAFPIQRSRLDLQHPDTGQRARIWLIDHTVPFFDGSTKEIHVSRLDETGHESRSHLYRLFVDGIVRRFDTPDRQGGQPRFATQKGLQESQANQALERKMGVNDQPIDAKEIEAIGTFRDEFRG